ncbi:hypothetical protein QOZ80_5AG0393380 [Eleusine coracana subsp. coracana]|nr:hypothetical protein QOZ80_5AG0393380 [Eleusine coracana subsp. coracana]
MWLKTTMVEFLLMTSEEKLSCTEAPWHKRRLHPRRQRRQPGRRRWWWVWTTASPAGTRCRGRSNTSSRPTSRSSSSTASSSSCPSPGAADVVSFVEADLMRVIKKAKDLCAQVSDAAFEVVEGDARNVLCEAVEKHRAELLVVGSHGYGAIKRAVLGSVSDYCIHHAHCTVMIVKKPKHNH